MKISFIIIIKIFNRIEDVNVVFIVFFVFSLFLVLRFLEVIEVILILIIWESVSIICWIGKIIVKVVIFKLLLGWLFIKIVLIILYNILVKNIVMVGMENLKSNVLILFFNIKFLSLFILLFLKNLY